MSFFAAEMSPILTADTSGASPESIAQFLSRADDRFTAHTIGTRGDRLLIEPNGIRHRILIGCVMLVDHVREIVEAIRVVVCRRLLKVFLCLGKV